MRSRQPGILRPLWMLQRLWTTFPGTTPLRRKQHPASASSHNLHILVSLRRPEPARAPRDEAISLHTPHKHIHDSFRATPQPFPDHDPLFGEAHPYSASRAISGGRAGTTSPGQNAHWKAGRFEPSCTHPEPPPSSAFVCPPTRANDEFRNPSDRIDPRSHLLT